MNLRGVRGLILRGIKMWNEEMIINLFFQKHKKERLLWELSTNKREEALKSLHDLKYVKREIMHPIPYYTEKYLEKELKKFGNFTNVYCMGLSYTGMLPPEKSNREITGRR